MTNLVVTFPGKFGDLLWMLPTLRALSRRRQHPIDLLLPAALDAIAPLLEQQPYIGSVITATHWKIENTAPASPRIPPPALLAMMPGAEWLHAGYRAWPTPNVVEHTLTTFNAQRTRGATLTLAELDLQTPWITLTGSQEDLEGVSYTETPWIAGFTDEYFELKFGLWQLLTSRRPFVEQAGMTEGDWRGEYLWEAEERTPLSISTGNRWRAEGFHAGTNWLAGAYWLSKTEAFLGDCSAWHVLAAAMGVPVVLMEPQAMRHNPVFYPLPSRQVTLVTGIDGQPTWDARHVAEALTDAIQWARVERTLP